MDRFFTGTTELLQNILLTGDSFSAIPEIYFKYLQFIPLFLIAFAVSLLLTPIVGHIANRYGIVDIAGKKRKNKLNRFDNPERHTHKGRIPNLGGLAVLIPLTVGILFFLPLNSVSIALLFSIVLLTVVGVLDDIYNLPASVQLAAQTLASLIIAIAVVDLPFVNNPFGGLINLNWLQLDFNLLTAPMRLILPGDLLLIPWVILCINALKWVSGSDGLLEGNMIIALFLIAVLGVRNQSAAIVALSIFLAGGISGFLVFNFPPAKIFSGSVGKTLFGFIVAVLAVMNGAKLAATILIIALPVVDALFVIAKRYIEHRPKNLLDLMRINDNEHLHHQLKKMKVGPTKILLIEASVTLFFGMVAVLTTGATKFALLLILLFFLSLGILYVRIRADRQKEEDEKADQEDSPESKYSY